jgi:pyroglutamyl-peptidase
MATLRVLLTGFGPFPGVPENPSAWLAETLAAQPSPPDCEIERRVFPTEWAAVAALAPRLHATMQPDVMIHFGLSQRANSLRLERSAHNRALPRADASGALPAADTIEARGRDRIDTQLSTATIARHLRDRGFAANASRSCGRYLCNSLYYRSLAWAARQESPRHVLFVHIPPTLRQGGPIGDDELLRAAQEILRFVTAAASQARHSGLASCALATSTEDRTIAEVRLAEAP